jgi:uracil-DNA glycosylase
MAVAPGYRSSYPQRPDVRNERPRGPMAAGARSTIATMSSTDTRREELKAVFTQARGCTRCPQLAATRTQVVFGAGHADADLMFVGEAPGAREDEQGLPFVGAAGKMLEELLAGVGLRREDVFIANVLKCLRDDAMVQLGDGSWERIGRLVRSEYSGTVMSVDEHGRLAARRVTGWHATPLGGRTVHRLTYRSAGQAGDGRAGIVLTGDHPVLTERGYVRADELHAGDRVATGQGLRGAAFDVVVGTLLGDGSITPGAASLTMSHSARQRAYARFKATLLEELAPVVEDRAVASVAGGERVDAAVHVRTRAHGALGVLREDFCRPRTRVPEWLAEELNARMLAIWFLDDGRLRVRGDARRPLAELSTVSFSDGDRQVLLHGLARLGLPAKAGRSRLYFDAPTSRRLSDLIARYVPESMRDRLHPETVALVAFDEEAWLGDDVRVLYDEVELEDVTDRERADTTFFCIDVQDTHNFVTAGGVVHNCRPPGNRDPAPIEIENCQEYLFRQVELIQPKVICTLGNFSTKLLRGDPTGITRVHGRRERRVIGTRAVWLYPIHHPAAALYTRSLQDTLREDFARLPAILAGPAPEQPAPPAPPAPDPEPEATAPPAEEPAGAEADAPGAEQLGLF